MDLTVLYRTSMYLTELDSTSMDLTVLYRALMDLTGLDSTLMDLTVLDTTSLKYMVKARKKADLGESTELCPYIDSTFSDLDTRLTQLYEDLTLLDIT